MNITGPFLSHFRLLGLSQFCSNFTINNIGNDWMIKTKVLGQTSELWVGYQNKLYSELVPYNDRMCRFVKMSPVLFGIKKSFQNDRLGFTEVL